MTITRTTNLVHIYLPGGASFRLVGCISRLYLLVYCICSRFSLPVLFTRYYPKLWRVVCARTSPSTMLAAAAGWVSAWQPQPQPPAGSVARKHSVATTAGWTAHITARSSSVGAARSVAVARMPEHVHQVSSWSPSNPNPKADFPSP